MDSDSDNFGRFHRRIKECHTPIHTMYSQLEWELKKISPNERIPFSRRFYEIIRSLSYAEFEVRWLGGMAGPPKSDFGASVRESHERTYRQLQYQVETLIKDLEREIPAGYPNAIEFMREIARAARKAGYSNEPEKMRTKLKAHMRAEWNVKVKETPALTGIKKKTVTDYIRKAIDGEFGVL